MTGPRRSALASGRASAPHRATGRVATRGRTVVVLSTAGSREEAERIAATLVDERLAACVNIVAPITSVYRWRGVVDRADEVLLLVKTRRSHAARVAARIRALHSYELPEAIVLPIDGGAPEYLAWLIKETAPPRRRRR